MTSVRSAPFRHRLPCVCTLTVNATPCVTVSGTTAFVGGVLKRFGVSGEIAPSSECVVMLSTSLLMSHAVQMTTSASARCDERSLIPDILYTSRDLRQSRYLTA